MKGKGKKKGPYFRTRKGKFNCKDIRRSTQREEDWAILPKHWGGKKKKRRGSGEHGELTFRKSLSVKSTFQ